VRYRVPQPDSSVHAAASSNARTPHPHARQTSGFPRCGGVSVNIAHHASLLGRRAGTGPAAGLPVRDRDWVVVGAQPQELESAGYLPWDGSSRCTCIRRPEESRARRGSARSPGYRLHHAGSPEVTLEEDLKAAISPSTRWPRVRAARSSIIRRTGGLAAPNAAPRIGTSSRIRCASCAWRARRPLRRPGLPCADETVQLMAAYDPGGRSERARSRARVAGTERALGEPRPEVFFEPCATAARWR